MQHAMMCCVKRCWRHPLYHPLTAASLVQVHSLRTAGWRWDHQHVCQGTSLAADGAPTPAVQGCLKLRKGKEEQGGSPELIRPLAALLVAEQLLHLELRLSELLVGSQSGGAGEGEAVWVQSSLWVVQACGLARQAGMQLAVQNLGCPPVLMAAMECRRCLADRGQKEYPVTHDEGWMPAAAAAAPSAPSVP
jgi:hypothetical protein